MSDQPKDPIVRRAVRQAGIQGQATISGARSRALVRRPGRRLLVGPWLAEVGFELLYWIPFARKLIARARVPPDRVLVVSRGGVGAWYGDAFGGYLDLYDLFDPDELHDRQRERVLASGGQKHTAFTGLDRDAIARVQQQLDEEFVILHPSLMFRRFRPVWMRRRTTAAVLRDVTPAPVQMLPRPDGLPPRYAAIKLYSSDCLPINREAGARVGAEANALTGNLPLVALSAGAEIDDHADLLTPEPRTGRGELSTNLRRQTAIIQHADALACTYGGFAYLGALCGIPTVALYERANFNILHLDVLTGELERLDGRHRASLSLVNVEHLRPDQRTPSDTTPVAYASARAPDHEAR